MANYKTVPNQKVVKVQKEQCNKQNLYATINLAAMEQAAQDLDAGAFKLWCYFAKNQNNYEFALSSTDAANSFGLKKRQYNSAVEELIEKRYLINTDGNNYTFNEISVITKCNNEEEKEKHVITKCNKDVITKCNNTLLQNDTRNITINNTINNTIRNSVNAISKEAKSKGIEELFQKEKFSALEFLNELEKAQAAQH